MGPSFPSDKARILNAPVLIRPQQSACRADLSGEGSAKKKASTKAHPGFPFWPTLSLYHSLYFMSQLIKLEWLLDEIIILVFDDVFGATVLEITAG